MKDLDFDELDRAVNSLMSNVPKVAPQTDDTKVKTLDIASTLDDDAAPSFSKVEEAAAKAANDSEMPVPSPAPVIPPEPVSKPAVAVPIRPEASPAPSARRGAGRFMDVVHPSADMKKPDAPRPVSRQGSTIEPLSASSQKIADVLPQKKEAKETDEKPVVTSAPVVEKEEIAVSTTPEAVAVEEPEKLTTAESVPTSDWPDPLDMASMNDEPKREEPPETPASEIEVPEESEMPAPLTSPFLPDAKVEKRPLGGNTLEETEDTGELSRAPAAIEEDVKKMVDDPNNQLPADPSEVNVELPEELHADLMAVEADTTHAEVKRAHEAEPEAIVPQEKEESTTPTEAKPEVKPVEESPVAAGPTSIPQQYREEPSTGDHDNGSIYDTDTYHQPLAHPVQKKSGWMWVVGIVGILLLGAAAGATLYFLKLV